jgi:hypothetical protein
MSTQTRPRVGTPDGMTFARRLRIMRRRTARWFQPPVRAHAADAAHPTMREDPAAASRDDSKSPFALH